MSDIQYIVSGTHDAWDNQHIPIVMLTDTEGHPLPLTLKVVQQFMRLAEQVRDHSEGTINVILLNPATGGPADIQALMKETTT